MMMAAGLGNRMRPLTDTRPKPLIELAGRTLLDRGLARLEAAGVETVVVNVHYLADMIEAICFRARSAYRHFRRTRPVAGHRRRYRQCAGALGDEAFFVVNSDSVWREGDVPCSTSCAAHGTAQDGLPARPGADRRVPWL